MPYQYKREPLSNEESDKLANAAESFQEKLVIFTLLDTGLRVSELSNLVKDNIQWQERRLVIYGKGGPYGKQTKRRVIPMTDRVLRVFHIPRKPMSQMSKNRRAFLYMLRLLKRMMPWPGLVRMAKA